MLKVSASFGDPVELNESEARQLADVLVQLAQQISDSLDEAECRYPASQAASPPSPTRRPRGSRSPNRRSGQRREPALGA